MESGLQADRVQLDASESGNAVTSPVSSPVKRTRLPPREPRADFPLGAASAQSRSAARLGPSKGGAGKPRMGGILPVPATNTAAETGPRNPGLAAPRLSRVKSKMAHRGKTEIRERSMD